RATPGCRRASRRADDSSSTSRREKSFRNNFAVARDVSCRTLSPAGPPPYPLPALSRIIPVVLLLFGSAVAGPVRADDNDRALLATFCDAGGIHGKTCKRAKGYPDAPKKGCAVTLGEDRTRGKFLGGNPLLLVSYESGCEAHTTDNGGVAVFEQAGGGWAFRGFQPGMQATCITVPDAQRDALVCLTGHMGQGIME